jgi:hypothetical protein
MNTGNSDSRIHLLDWENPGRPADKFRKENGLCSFLHMEVHRYHIFHMAPALGKSKQATGVW